MGQPMGQAPGPLHPGGGNYGPASGGRPLPHVGSGISAPPMQYQAPLSPRSPRVTGDRFPPIHHPPQGTEAQTNPFM